MENRFVVLRRAFALVVVICALAADRGLADETSSAEQKPTPEAIEFFEARIRPVLLKHCYECHSAESTGVKGGLLLDTRAATRKGGDSGAAVVPGNVDESLLIGALRHESFEMPPSGKLPDAVIADFVKWIEMGAPDPREGEVVAKGEIDFEAARKFWSFQPIRQPEPPAVKDAAWPTNEIDRFVLAKLEEMKLQPVAPAGRRELIRRATFDLIGLPPTPEEVEAFIADESPEAFRKVIDRLLESEHYGERWGRYWLDVARYSEDQAHTFAVRPNNSGYRYRDWVIDAFNADMPYDQFVRLQIAGDLIGPEAPGNYDHLVALGFFGLGAQYYKNSDAAKAAADELDDRVDTLSRGFLGLTVSCARCHDHKFDPIPTQDYYSLAGIFSSSKLHNAPLCPPEDVKAYNDGQQRIKQADEALKKFLADAKESAAEAKVDQIAAYMETVWRYQAAKSAGTPLATAALAKTRGVNEFLLKRWIEFLDPKQKGKVSELDEWFALDAASLKSDDAEVPAEVVSVAKLFQERVERGISVRDGVVTQNLVDAEMPHKPGTPRFVSPLVTKVRPTAGIDVDIRGAKELILVVSDGGNGRSCDHADWIAPKIVGEKGELKLTELKWKKNDGDLGARINANYQGKPIRVGGKKYDEGIGVHATSTITYDLPEGYDRFQAIGGIDNSGTDQGGCGDDASVQFSVYTETPTSGPVVPGKDLLTIVLGKDGPFTVSDADLENFLTGDKQQELLALKEAAETAKQTAPPMYGIAHSYAEGKIADMKVFVRGNPANQREVAPRRFLRVIAGDDRPQYTDGSGRRQLADAIASHDNPLTARVMANRIWQHHFGRGIVGTPSNFGTLGEAPTHPALLDYLAARFIESGWSIKTLHREIMLSSTYRLSTENSDVNSQIDADNRYLWRMNRQRLDVEAWRDALLDVAGRLDRSLGGPSTNLADTNNVRRTVYAKVSRHELDSLLRLFDFPDANITSEKRTETTVPQQQLFVLNSPFMTAQAKAFAARLQREAPGNDEARIRLAFQLAYGRSPEDVEVELGLAYLSQEPDPQNKLSPWESYAQILLGSNEFMYLD